MSYKFPALAPLPDFRAKGAHTSAEGYLDKVAGSDVPAGERSKRRRRFLCEECGRPLVLVLFDRTGATWTCSCGYSTRAQPRSSLYRRARDLQDQHRGAS